jgi:hypothetical protein
MHIEMRMGPHPVTRYPDVEESVAQLPPDTCAKCGDHDRVEVRRKWFTLITENRIVVTIIATISGLVAATWGASKVFAPPFQTWSNATLPAAVLVVLAATVPRARKAVPLCAACDRRWNPAVALDLVISAGMVLLGLNLFAELGPFRIAGAWQEKVGFVGALAIWAPAYFAGGYLRHRWVAPRLLPTVWIQNGRVWANGFAPGLVVWPQAPAPAGPPMASGVIRSEGAIRIDLARPRTEVAPAFCAAMMILACTLVAAKLLLLGTDVPPVFSLSVLGTVMTPLLGLVAWAVGGREELVLDREAMTQRVSLGPWSRTRRYAFSRIRGLQSTAGRTSLGRWILKKPQIAFEYEGRREGIGIELPPGESDRVVEFLVANDARLGSSVVEDPTSPAGHSVPTDPR